MGLAGRRSTRRSGPLPLGRGAHRTVAALSCLLLVGVEPVSAQTIPPGQEAVVATMLGSGEQLPGGCTFAGGEIDHEVVRATYRCPDGDLRIDLHPRDAPGARTITTEAFALTVASGPPHEDLIAAIAARVRARESELERGTLVGARRGHAPSPFGVPTSVFALLLALLAGASWASGRRARAARRPADRGARIEALAVAALVVLWLQIDATPPAHQDTAVDVALARDCLLSGGELCLGHTASAIGLAQGQGFTYALAGWLHFGLSMRALALVAACGLGGAIGLLHFVIARRFGAAAWIASALAAPLAVAMTGYPTMWNPSWFVLPLTIAFVALLALARDGGSDGAFVAGIALALTSESHLLFGTFVAVAVAIVVLTARRPAPAAGVLVASFLLTEIVISPASSAQNARILSGWLGVHRAAAAAFTLLLCLTLASVGRLRRALRDDHARRESATVLAWVLAGAVGLGLALPWAVSRPPQIRYFGAAFPAIGYGIGWLFDAVGLRARPASARLVAGAILAALFWQRMVTADPGSTDWHMDDGPAVATSAELAETSALDVQLAVRPIPGGPLAPATAAFAGTAEASTPPTRIVRAILPASRTVPPPGWRRLRSGRREIFTSDIDAWSHPEEAEVCPDPADGGPCVTLTHVDFDEVARGAGGLLHREFGFRIARSASRIAQWAAHGTRSLLWRIPVRADGADALREILVQDATDERIVTVDGARWTRRSDRHATVEHPAPGAAAVLVVQTPIADKFEAGIPPLPFELRREEADALRDSLAER